MPEPKVFRDRYGARLDLRKNSHVGSPQFLISNVSGTTVQFVIEPDSFPGFVEALFAATGEQVFLVEDPDVDELGGHRFGPPHPAYGRYYRILEDSEEGNVRFERPAYSPGCGGTVVFTPAEAVEAGTWFIALGRRMQAAHPVDVELLTSFIPLEIPPALAQQVARGLLKHFDIAPKGERTDG